MLRALALGERAQASRRGTAEVFAFDTAAPADPAAERVVRAVAAARSVPVPMFFHTSRCEAPVAQARQIAMYLVHVVLQRNYLQVGRYFRRDRTTVAHACALVEDLRDDPALDDELVRLEETLKSELGAL